MQEADLTSVMASFWKTENLQFQKAVYLYTVVEELRIQVPRNVHSYFPPHVYKGLHYVQQ